MAAHSTDCAQHFARRLCKRADEIAPPLDEAERVRGYVNDPIGFARDVLGISPWSKQAEILTAVLHHRRVSTVSGHKVGKSTALAILALWFYCSYPDGRVVITATTDRQVNGIIWKEVKRLIRTARLAIPGAADIKIRANGGLDNPRIFSEIRGYTAKEAEAIAGISGPAILYLVDEASGVADEIYEAIEGNRAAGTAWVFLISNPTRADGEFYDSHHSKSKDALPRAGYYTIHISSADSPNVTGEWRTLEEWSPAAQAWRLRAVPVPGLAAQEYIDEKREEWGEESPQFKIRVAGLFCAAEEAKIFPLALLTACQARWDDGIDQRPPQGRLHIGCDPAGDGDGGDESGFAARIEYRILEVRARSGMSPQAHCDTIDDLIATHHQKGQPLPIVNVESEGEAGWKVYCEIRDYAYRRRHFICVRVRTSERAIRQPRIYGRVRDEVWASARAWARQGGALPTNAKLEKDLHTPEWTSDVQARQQVTPKKELRKLLGRSPDTGDAVVLSCWESTLGRSEAAPDGQPFDDDGGSPGEAERVSPYQSLNWARR